MLDKIKLDLRISNSAYDEEITDLIEACKLDLTISGVASSLIIEDDPLIIQAIKTYCKAYFGYDNSDSEKLKDSYSLLKQHLSIAYAKDDDSIQELIHPKEEE